MARPSRVRTAGRVAAAIALAFVGLAWQEPAHAGLLQPGYGFQKGGKATTAGTITLRLKWKDVGGVNEQSVTVDIPKDTDYEKAAELAVDALNKNPILSADWTFTKVPFGTGNNTWQAQGKSKDGRKAESIKASMRNPDVEGLPATAEIDPIYGVAQFDVTGTPQVLSLSDTIFVGIAGVVAGTSDARLDDLGMLVAKTDDQIKLDLRDALRAEGLNSAYVDPITHLLTVPNVSLGDPAGSDGMDVGALFASDVEGIGGFAQVAAVPEPSSLLLVSTAALAIGAAGARRRRRSATGKGGPCRRARPRPGRALRVAVLGALIGLVLLPCERKAVAGLMEPTFVVRRGPAKTGGNYVVTLEWKTNAVASQTATVTVAIPKDTERKDAADLFVAALNKDNTLNKDWKFSARGVPMFINAVYVIKGVPVGNNKPKMIENSIEDAGITGMGGAAGIDPIYGTARFDVTGTPQVLSLDDTITIGIAGFLASTSGARLDDHGVLVAKTDDQIKLDLRDALRAEGLSSADINPMTHLLTVRGVSLGDPEGTDGVDVGALFDTEDPGLGGFAQVAAVPEPGVLALLGSAALTLIAVTAGRRWTRRKGRGQPLETI